MSGIYGSLGGEGSEKQAGVMSRRLAHRGPDGDGRHSDARITLGCRRLDVFDPGSAPQPYTNESETVWVVLDGAIGNHAELHRELEQKGHRFRSRADGEVIAHLYEEHGENCVKSLRGLFAFALWDAERGILLLARDRLGQKPLFYAWDGGRFLFASEIKAILAAHSAAPEIDYEAVHHYLSLRFVPPPLTMLRHVHKLPAAHVLVLSGRDIAVRPYWSLSFRNKLELSDEEFVDSAGAALADAVSSHSVGEVEVGAFLSGGLDSGLIVAMMAKGGKGRFPTFTVGVDDAVFDEARYAREVAERFGTEQFETQAQTNILDWLPDVISHLDEPSDPVAASKYLGSRLAGQRVSVVLGGDAGDELFAGFDRYTGIAVAQRYARLPASLRARLLGPAISRLPASFGYSSIAEKARWVHQVAEASDTARRFAEAVCFFRFNHARKHALWGERIWRQVSEIDSSALVADAFGKSDAEAPEERMAHADYMLRLPEHSLMLTDRLGMAHGVEVRSPLADHELVEHLARFPLSMKIRGRQAKYVARRLAQRELPPGIAGRPKRGFRFPLAAWFAGELYGFVDGVLRESELVRSGTFRRETVERLLLEHRHRRVDNHVRLWMLINLEIWHKLIIEQRELSDVRRWMQGVL